MKSTINKNNILKRIEDLGLNKNLLNFRILMSKDKELADDIRNFTNFLPESAKLNERLYCIQHDIFEQQICPQCGKNALEFAKGKYRQFCSIKCLNSSDSHKRHCEETSLKHFGVRHHSQSTEMKEYQRKKNLEKYGVEHTFQRKDVIDKCQQTKHELMSQNPDYWKDREDKSRQTKIENGHDPNWRNIEKAIQTKRTNLENDPNFYDYAYAKRSQTCIERYGARVNAKKIKETYLKHVSEDPEFKNRVVQKQKQTKFERYGSETYNNMEKNRQTKLERYGSETYNNMEKNRQTMLEKYGVENFFQTDEIKKQTVIFNKKLSYEKFILNNEYDIPLFSLDDYLKRDDEHECLKFKCKKCGYEFETWHHDGHHRHCPKCYPNNVSAPERELMQFITELNIEIKTNDRTVLKPFELDIYIQSRKLAIEFDGLYWHSENESKDPAYHLRKTLECEKRGIQLIHIFENEWKNKQNIVKSRLRNLLGVYDKTIYARKCSVKEIDLKTSRNFQNMNHLQGFVNSSINLGLFYDNELVSLMTFGASRFNKKYQYELLRFCNKLNYHIPGAAGKLLKYFERNYNPKSLISYADRRWSVGNLYRQIGFTLDHASKPDYWYWKSFKLESRIKYQKHKLKKLLPIFDENKSEAENMKINGYHRIYDCGNLVFTKQFS